MTLQSNKIKKTLPGNIFMLLLFAIFFFIQTIYAQQSAPPPEVPPDYAETTVKGLSRNPGRWVGTKIYIQGIVDRYDEIETSKVNVFLLEDVFGYRIRVQTTEALPEAKSKVVVWGDVNGDEAGQELYITLKGYVNPSKKEAGLHITVKDLLLLFALLSIFAILLLVLVFRMKRTPGTAGQKDFAEPYDDAATIRIDPKNVRIPELDDPTVKILPGHFIITKGANEGLSIPICYNTVTIGRSHPSDPQNKIAIDDDTKTVSRKQAVISYEDERFYLQNKAAPDQKNPTRLNGTPMQKDEKKLLTSNNSITIGYVELKFIEGPVRPTPVNKFNTSEFSEAETVLGSSSEDDGTKPFSTKGPSLPDGGTRQTVIKK